MADFKRVLHAFMAYRHNMYLKIAWTFVPLCWAASPILALSFCRAENFYSVIPLTNERTGKCPNGEAGHTMLWRPCWPTRAACVKGWNQSANRRGEWGAKAALTLRRVRIFIWRFETILSYLCFSSFKNSWCNFNFVMTPDFASVENWVHAASPLHPSARSSMASSARYMTRRRESAPWWPSWVFEFAAQKPTTSNDHRLETNIFF